MSPLSEPFLKYYYFPYYPFNAGIKSLCATLPTEISYWRFENFEGLIARRLYKSFGVKGIVWKFPSVYGT
jgi:hypothetical protein